MNERIINLTSVKLRFYIKVTRSKKKIKKKFFWMQVWNWILFWQKSTNLLTIWDHIFIKPAIEMHVNSQSYFLNIVAPFLEKLEKYFDSHLLCICIPRDQLWIVIPLLMSTHEILNINESIILKFNYVLWDSFILTTTLT